MSANPAARCPSRSLAASGLFRQIIRRRRYLAAHIREALGFIAGMALFTAAIVAVYGALAVRTVVQ